MKQRILLPVISVLCLLGWCIAAFLAVHYSSVPRARRGIAEPALHELLKASPIIVVAEPVLGNFPAMGELSEAVLVKYAIKFRIKRVLKSDRKIRPGDILLTRLALYNRQPDENTFKPQEGKLLILFLRKTQYEEGSFENTSIWFGVMNHSEKREWMLEYAIKEATVSDGSR